MQLFLSFRLKCEDSIINKTKSSTPNSYINCLQQYPNFTFNFLLMNQYLRMFRTRDDLIFCFIQTNRTNVMLMSN